MSTSDDDLSALPHLNARGEAHMVDVGDKPSTRRVAKAGALVRLSPATMELLRRGTLQKGDALAVARIAGIAASKKTPDLVLLCHPLSLSHVSVDLHLDDEAGGVRIETTAETTGPTGVEMEALTAATVAALNLYDMIKKTDRGASIEQVCLHHKTGGASGDWDRQ